MKIVGLIAEYNPFHNGHKYHIEKAKEVTEADHVIVVMSGDFVQRGTPSIMPKRLRCEAALKAGASLVIELPTCYSTASAESFAFGAVSILDKLGCVDAICFGSECGEIKNLELLAKILIEEPAEYKEALQYYLRQGESYPAARQKAMYEYFDSDVATPILAEPNNILGIEYLKALHKISSEMKPYTISREFSKYHDKELNEVFSSASAIRKEINENGLENIEGHIPEEGLDLFTENFENRFPVVANDFSLLLKYRLLKETKESLSEYLDVSEELANRIINNRNQFVDYDQFCELLKTKEVTYSRISRALLHILLEIKKDDLVKIENARVLGFRKDSTAVLSAIKETSMIPLVGKVVGIEDPMILKDVFAANLYESVVTDKFKTPYMNEYEQSIVLV